MEDFFTDDELTKPFQIRAEVLPTKHDCLLYVITRTKAIKSRTNFTNLHHDSVVLALAEKVVK